MRERELTRADTATALRQTPVGRIMSTPLVTCSPDVPLQDVARLMAAHRIHSVVMLAEPDRSGRQDELWGVVSELDLVGAAAVDQGEVVAGTVAASPIAVIGADDAVARAALLMAEYATSHLIVVGGDGAPVGIVSALDVATLLAAAAEPAPARASEPATVSTRLVAAPGDRLVIAGHVLDEPERHAEILEVRGADGGPPFLVRWEDSGRVSLHYPGSDARIRRTATGGRAAP